jgi:hypothetical protein
MWKADRSLLLSGKAIAPGSSVRAKWKKGREVFLIETLLPNVAEESGVQ